MSRDFQFSKRLDNKETITSVEKALGETKRVDDALLHALSLVLSANGDYARSVANLLESDLEKEQSLEDIKEKIDALSQDTDKLIRSQEQLVELLGSFNEEYKEFLDQALLDAGKKQQDYLDKKFSTLFKNAGLKDDGTEYGPSDQLIVKVKSLLSNELWILATGAVLYQIIIWIIQKYSLTAGVGK